MSVVTLNKQIRVTTLALTQAHRQLASARSAQNAAQNAYDGAQRVTRPSRLLRTGASLQALLRRLEAARTTVVSAEGRVNMLQATLNSLNAQLQALLTPPSPPQPVAATAPTRRFARALLVGINYVGTPYELYGCINDVLNTEKQLRSFFPGNAEYRVLTDNTPLKPTRANIMASITWLVSGLKAGENVYFHYSGHGGRVRDTNGDEVTGLDSCIYPCNDGRMETITDDELRTALAVQLPAGCKCFAVLDACHSGTGVDLRYRWETPAVGTLSYSEDTKYEKTAGDIIFLSGCMDTQYAADTVDNTNRPAGALTWALLDVWRTYGPAIKTKYLLWDIRSFLKKNGYPQIPQLSTGRYTDLQGIFDLSC